MHSERLINRRRQGDLGEASAIEWLTRMGANVLLPLGHSPDYDLVGRREEVRPLRFDYLFILAGDGTRWFIPAIAIEAATNVTVGGTKYSEYRIESGLPIQQIVYGN